MRSAADVARGFSLCLPRSMPGLLQLGGWVDQIAEALVLPAAQEYALRLCLEEAIANLVMHAEPVSGQADGRVTAQVQTRADGLLVTIEDACAPFDLLLQPVRDQQKHVASGAVGGLGIHLMRHHAQAISYQQRRRTNRLTLTIPRDPG